MAGAAYSVGSLGDDQMNLAFGVFDHLDASGAPLREFYEDRLKLVELVRPARLLLLSGRRASFDATRHGALPERVPFRRRAAHQAAQFRPAGLHAAALSPDPADRGNLHARSDERRALPVRRRQGHLADRGALLRRSIRTSSAKMFIEAFEVLMRGLAKPHARFRRRVLPLQERAAGGRAAAEAASAAVVRRRHAAKHRAARARPA